MKKLKIFAFSFICAVSLCSCDLLSVVKESSSSATTSKASRTGNVIINFYAVNDFHGSILEKDNYYYEGGMAKVFGYLRKKKQADPEHTVILSSGDMWQGSLESNYNRGKCITEAMNEVGFDAFTLGNHDFDYGIDKLLENKEIANFPFLAGNIVNYGTSTKWSNSESYTVLERDGIKIGIIGEIGEGQTTSILSSHVAGIDFVNPNNDIKNSVKELQEQNCSIIILSEHNNAEKTISSTSGITGLSGAFCAHSHYEERTVANGVPYLQGACNGEYISHLAYRVTPEGKVSLQTYENIKADSSWEEDSKVNDVFNKYCDASFNEMANEKVGKLTGKNLSSSGVACLASKAMYYFLEEKELGYDLACTICNSQRYSIYQGDFTYSDVYKAAPFFNQIMVLYVSGADILSEAEYGLVYRNSDIYNNITNNEFYYIGIIDYLGIHQNIYKKYDYFPSLNNHPERIIATYENFPADIISSYVKNNLKGVVNGYDFTSTSEGFC